MLRMSPCILMIPQSCYSTSAGLPIQANMTGIYKPKILVTEIEISLFTNLFLLKSKCYEIFFFCTHGTWISYVLVLFSTMSKQSSILGKAEDF